jgi:hypothetical protein
MPLHYAFSELLIVLAALWCILQLGRDGRGFAAAGTALFGMAAAIGIYRIVTGGSEPIANIHRIASQYGGLAGMGLIALAFARPYWRKTGKRVGLALIALSLVIAIIKPDLAVPLFLVWAVSVVIEAFFYAGKRRQNKLLASLAVSLVLVNLLFVRQSDALGPDLSWHGFHTLLAVWLVFVAPVLTMPNRRA